MGPLRVKTPPRPRALTIAGSDSGGGAGIQADLKTFSVLGVFGMSAITAVTVQNTKGVEGYEPVPASIVAAQIRAVASDIGVDAAKTGMLADADIVRAVAEAVGEEAIAPLVVDPVSMSKHGHPLLEEEAVGVLRAELLPRAALITPNLPEAAILSGRDVSTRDDMRMAAETILTFGAGAVLVKGGHVRESRGHALDLFMDGTVEEWLDTEWIDTLHTHGTGCTLSAAIVAHLAAGVPLLEAVRAGKFFVTEAIRHALALGDGIGPVDPLWPVARPEPRG
jgi:hydroxymethylpyrimidine/phosphomethylpyrimidine kinase